MDPASKSTLKIVGVVVIVAMVGAFGYNSMRKNSLEQTGRVYEQAQMPTVLPCSGSSISSVTTANGECSSVHCSDGSIGDLPPGASNGTISADQASNCGATSSGDNAVINYTGSSDVMSCLIGVCMGISNSGSSLNQQTGTTKTDTNTGKITPRTKK